MLNKILNILIFISFLTLELYSQNEIEFFGSPFIKNYTHEDYNASTQIWDIEQDKNGLLYFGCNEKMIVFDGHSWSQYQVRNKTVIRSIEIADDGKIFVGASDEFGFFKPNSIGDLKYVSLSKFIPDTVKLFQDIWQLHITKKAVYFVSLDYIFVWKNEKIEIIKKRTYSNNTFEINDKIYANTKNGFCVLNNNKFDTLPNCDILKTPSVFFNVIKLDNDNVFISTRAKGFFKYNLNDKKLSKLKLSDTLKSFIEKNVIYKAIALNKNRIALSTLHGGILIIDRNGKFLQVINKQRGLIGNNIYSLYFDKDNNLWAGIQGGISRIDLSYPAQIFSEKQNIPSYIMDFTVFKNKLYVATINKLYLLTKYRFQTKKDNHLFKAIHGIGGCWQFLEKNQKLFTFGYSGISQIIDENSKFLTNFDKIELTANYFKKYKNKIFIGFNSGFGYVDLIEKNDNSTQISNFFRFKEISEDIRNITFDNNGNIWLSTYTSGPIFIRFNNNSLKNYNVTKFYNNNGLPNDINAAYVKKINNKINILTSKGIYKPIFPNKKNYTDSLIKFLHDKTWGNFISNDSLNVIDIIHIKDNKYLFMGDKIGYLSIFNDSIHYNTKPFTRFKHFTKVDFLSDSIIGIGTPKSFVVYNINNSKNYNKKYNVLFRKITIRKDSVIFKGYFSENDTVKKNQTPNINPVFKYDNNNITFEFAAMFFEEHENIMYKCKLEGFDHEWSIWKHDNKITFTNIPEGEYTLKVKAKNIYETESYISEFKFKILPPWYRTWWAYIFYAIIGLIIIAIALIIQRNQHKKITKIYKLEQKMLRLQMKPHFIFNVLSNIQSFMNQNDRKQASLYLSKFARLIRNVLEQSRKEFISISKEIQIIKYYIELQQLRFKNKFNFYIHIDENIDSDTIFIPPLLIQPLLENAIEHGIAKTKYNSTIKIFFRKDNNNLFVEILDYGQENETKIHNSATFNVYKESSVSTKIIKEQLNIFQRKMKQDFKMSRKKIFINSENIIGTKVIIQMPFVLKY